MKAGSQDRLSHLYGLSGSLKSDGTLFMFFVSEQVLPSCLRINMAIISKNACQITCHSLSYYNAAQVFLGLILSAAKGHEGRQPGQIKSHVWPIRVVEE